MSQVYCILLISMCVKLCQPINTMCQSILHMKCFVEKKNYCYNWARQGPWGQARTLHILLLYYSAHILWHSTLQQKNTSHTELLEYFAWGNDVSYKPYDLLWLHISITIQVTHTYLKSVYVTWQVCDLIYWYYSWKYYTKLITEYMSTEKHVFFDQCEN